MKANKYVYIQLHANYENCRAQRLYHACGFLCNEFKLNGYPEPHDPQYKFGHMIRMELNIQNIKNKTDVCSNPKAIEISQQEKDKYGKLCQTNKPSGLLQPCQNVTS